MATQTEKLGLLKPTYDEPADIAVINENMDKIDTRFAQNETAINKKTNLGTPSVNTSSAYVKNVPDTSAPYAQINKIGGMSYKDGNTLRDAKVTEVKSVGINIWDEKFERAQYSNSGGLVPTPNALDIASKNKIPVKPSTNYYGTFLSNTPWRLFYYDRNGVFISYSLVFKGNTEFTTPSNCYYMTFYTSDYGETYNHNICINKSNTEYNGKYYPSIQNTLVIPEAVQSLEGYGQSNPDNAEEYNYIDLKNQKFISFGYISNSVWVSRYSTTDIDISSIIGVEGNGTITFENEYGYNVPYEIEYTINSNDVIGAKEFVGDLKGIATRAENAKTAETAAKATYLSKGEWNRVDSSALGSIQYILDLDSWYLIEACKTVTDEKFCSSFVLHTPLELSTVTPTCAYSSASRGVKSGTTEDYTYVSVDHMPNYSANSYTFSYSGSCDYLRIRKIM